MYNNLTYTLSGSTYLLYNSIIIGLYEKYYLKKGDNYEIIAGKSNVVIKGNRNVTVECKKREKIKLLRLFLRGELLWVLFIFQFNIIYFKNWSFIKFKSMREILI